MVWDLPLLETEKTDIPEPDGTLAVNTAASPGGNSPLLWSLENRPHSADFTDRSHEHNTCPELIICPVYTTFATALIFRIPGVFLRLL